MQARKPFRSEKKFVPRGTQKTFFDACRAQRPSNPECGGVGAGWDGYGRESCLTFGECCRGHIRHVHPEEQVLLGLEEEPWEVSLHGSKLLDLVFHRCKDLSKSTGMMLLLRSTIPS